MSELWTHLQRVSHLGELLVVGGRAGGLEGLDGDPLNFVLEFVHQLLLSLQGELGALEDGQADLLHTSLGGQFHLNLTLGAEGGEEMRGQTGVGVLGLNLDVHLEGLRVVADLQVNVARLDERGRGNLPQLGDGDGQTIEALGEVDVAALGDHLGLDVIDFQVQCAINL